jgi:hypothetical protein
MGEEVSFPYDAILFLAISMIIFLYTMLGDYFAAQTADLFVYLIYGMMDVVSVAFAAFLTTMYDKEERGGEPF